ncbi:MAG: virulence RhuM family protein [Fibrobacter sp.]|nr:virulence RhuM family protein [Fibrobacter sp.]
MDAVFFYEVKMDQNDEKTGEIVLYQPEGAIKLEVRVENETVWLNRQQIALLFNRDIKTIGKHIANALREECQNSVVAKFATTAEDGKNYQVEHYDLDMILSIGYRVKSANGVKFRQWANQVLKDHLLKGYSLNRRMLAAGMQLESRFQEQEKQIESQKEEIAEMKVSVNSQDARIRAVENHIDFFVKAAQLPNGGIIAPNTRFDGYVLIADLVKTAKKSVVFIDPFADISVLKFAAMKAKGVSATIYSARISHQFKEEAALYKKQHPEFDLKTMRVIHDRFLLVDDTVYHFGASFKDMGAEFSAYSVLNFVTPEEVIEKVQEVTKESSSKKEREG